MRTSISKAISSFLDNLSKLIIPKKPEIRDGLVPIFIIWVGYKAISMAQNYLLLWTGAVFILFGCLWALLFFLNARKYFKEVRKI
jgi:hypothetical protein